MNQHEPDPARQEEQIRQQILELLRLVVREMVRRIAAAGNSSPGAAETPGSKQRSTTRKSTR
jgi:hypothetical protein